MKHNHAIDNDIRHQRQEVDVYREVRFRMLHFGWPARNSYRSLLLAELELGILQCRRALEQ